jgi:hypothetical protein
MPMPSSDINNGLVRNDAYLCSTSCYRSEGNTLLILKFDIEEFPLSKEYYGVVLHRLHVRT